ncbi:Lipid-A-disaccharide synthase [hydrothermal vent metagenome]|uniref:lipid-A-disaccharide synthase n=1 Tax=hydrothermal vent metagenome TaxID=652676 RepID=A0A3B0VEN0_9ZZZZ
MTSNAGNNNEIIIVAGEASGDMHGARLVTEMLKLRPGLNFRGVGGSYLRQAGVDIMFPAEELAVVGIAEVLSQLNVIRRALKGIGQHLRRRSPALLILIDFPDFNLILAAKAKKLGIPVFYYISPQVWAWRQGRVKTIARRVTKLAVILPFEQEFFQRHGLRQVEFVGHPLVDQVNRPDRQAISDFRARHHIAPSCRLIGLLPGSRRKEIQAMLPIFLKTAALLKKRHRDIIFLLPLAPSLKQVDIDPLIAGTNLPLKIITEERYLLMAASDLVMAASGTVTLELALLRTPMVVCYRLSALTYFLGHRLIKAAFASLVNLVAGREIVKELLQKEFTAPNLLEAVEDIWPGSAGNKRMRKELAEVAASLGHQGASAKAARLAIATMEEGGGSYPLTQKVREKSEY